MNTSSFTDLVADHVPNRITDHVPNRAAAAAAISSTLDEITDLLADIPEIDAAAAARRTHRAVARSVPGVTAHRSRSTRWLLITGGIVAIIAAAMILRRRSAGDPESRRDDWSTPTSGDSRPPRAHEREPLTSAV